MPKNQPTTQESPLLYSGMNTGHSESVMDQQHPKCLLIQRLDELTINTFKRAYFRGELEGLIKEGIPGVNELTDTWESLLFDYSSLIKSSDSSYLLKLKKQVEILSLDIEYIEGALIVLPVQFDAEIASHITNVIGIDCEYTPENRPEFERQINRTRSLLKSKKQDLSELQDELLKLENIHDSKPQTEDEFDATVVMLSKFIGYRIDKDVVTMDEFAHIFTLLITQDKPTQSDGRG